MFYYFKYFIFSGLFLYIGLLKFCDGLIFFGLLNWKLKEGGILIWGFWKFGFLKLILLKILNFNLLVGLKCKVNYMLKMVNELILVMYWIIIVEVFLNKCVCFIFILGC